MSLKQLSTWLSPDKRVDKHDRELKTSSEVQATSLRFGELTLTRRRFVEVSAAATYLGIEARCWPLNLIYPKLNWPSQHALARPIPGGILSSYWGNNRKLHVFLPGHGSEPSTITDFKGFVGVAHITGRGTGTRGTNSTPMRLLFDADVRFMKGEYVGMNGRLQQGALGCICLDLFTEQIDIEHQIHNFEPGIHPNGLFWTTPISPESVSVSLGARNATVSVSDISMRDFHDVPNALQNGDSRAVTVSFRVQWCGIKRRTQIFDGSNSFTGHFIEDAATIEWSAKQRGFSFVSDPATNSTSAFALIGYEHNGIFMREPMPV